MENEFPSNSKYQSPSKQKVITAGPKDIKPVVSGNIIRRKPPIGKLFRETFISGDARTALGFAITTIVVPYSKNVLYDSFTQFVKQLIFDNQRPNSYREPRFSTEPTSSYVNYSRYSAEPSSRYRSDLPNKLSQKARSNHDFDEIILATRVEAEAVIDQLFDILSRYEVVTVADLYDSMGLEKAYTDSNWGWTSLKGSGVSKISKGYLLDLPKPSYLE